MKPTLFLRIAAILSLLASCGHTYLFLTYFPSHGPQETAVVAAMKSARFHFGWPASHSYWELYFGYGLFVAISCFIEAVVLWQLASLSKSGSLRIEPIVATFVLGEAGYAVLMFKYFFLIPIFVHSALAVCLAAAFLASSPREKAVAESRVVA